MSPHFPRSPFSTFVVAGVSGLWLAALVPKAIAQSSPPPSAPSPSSSTDSAASLANTQERSLGEAVTPANLEPANLEPANLEPASPEPASPEPASPEPANLEPASPEPASPEPVNLKTTNPEQAQSLPPAAVLPAPLATLSPPPLPPLPGPRAYIPQVPMRLVLRLSERQVHLWKGDRHLASYPVAIGRDGWETPTGQFEVLQMISNPSWEHPFTRQVIPPGEDNPLGVRWIGFWTDGNNFIGFHGTPNPNLIGQAVSHGCVRMRNADIVELFEQVDLGTDVTVEP